MLLPIVLALASTLLIVVWLFLLFQANNEDWVQAAYFQVICNLDKVQQLERKDRQNAAKLERYQGIQAKAVKLLLGGNHQKQIEKLTRANQNLQAGDLRSISTTVIPGYVLQRKVDVIGKGNINKKLYGLHSELFGKKYAGFRTQHLLAQFLSYPILGTAASLALGAIFLGLGNSTGGLAVVLLGTLLVIVLVYALYDDLTDKVAKRRAAISRQFPNVVSKLALLVTSGMIMDRAWKETAFSQEGELYMEMRKVSEERDNLVDPSTAYANFIDRCATKEATKLASAIIQNQSKGNAEIGALLKNMAHEAWQERRHTAKRDSEKANSKLMIPTMMLFVAILVMIMVPVVTSFSGL